MAVGRRVVSTTVTVGTDIIREHRCQGCGHVFNYPMVVRASSTSKYGANVWGANQQLADNVKTAFEIVPCPKCKMLQSEMVQRMRSEDHDDGIGAAILGIIIMVLPLLLNGVWHRVAASLLMAFILMSWGLLQQMNLNPNRMVSRKCRLRKRPGTEGMTANKRVAYALFIVALIAAPSLFLVSWIYPEKVELENLTLEPAWAYAGDELIIRQDPTRKFHTLNNFYLDEAEISYVVAGQSYPLETVGSQWKYDRAFTKWTSHRSTPADDLQRLVGTKQQDQTLVEDQLIPAITVRIPDSVPTGSEGLLKVSWLITYPRISAETQEVMLMQQMLSETINFPIRPSEKVWQRTLAAALKPTLGLIASIALVLGLLLIPSAAKIRGFKSSIVLQGSEYFGSGEPTSVPEKQHS